MSQLQDKIIGKKQNRQTALFALWGGIVTAVILLVTAVWVSDRARAGTDQAVDRVSEFYLEELAGRRVQVVQEELKNNFSFIENALDILKPSDLESQDALRSFLGEMRKLYDVEKFAFVDENGIVYTRHSTASGLSRYSFLSEELTGPVISTANLYGAKKQVVFAVPVEGVVFQGAKIKVCFIQINIDNMLSSLTLQANDNETYCNLYYRNGESLTNTDLGHLKAGSNLLLNLKDADIAGDHTIREMEDDFKNGRSGHVSFYYRGAKEDLCYTPVEGTNWMLSILILLK